MSLSSKPILSFIFNTTSNFVPGLFSASFTSSTSLKVVTLLRYVSPNKLVDISCEKSLSLLKTSPGENSQWYFIVDPSVTYDRDPSKKIEPLERVFISLPALAIGPLLPEINKSPWQ